MCTAKYAYVIVLLQYVLTKSYGVFDSPTPDSKHLGITVSVFICALELTALLLESFHFHFCSDTLVHVVYAYTTSRSPKEAKVGILWGGYGQ